MMVDGAPETKLAVYRLNVSSSELLDSVKTDKNGRFKYSVPVSKGQPEFVYVYNGDTRLASLLLENGERVMVKADTVGNFIVSGAAGTEKLADVERDYQN